MSGVAPKGEGPGRQRLDGGRELHIVGCYHPSPRNTFTGRLTPAMLRDLLASAASLAGPHTRTG